MQGVRRGRGRRGGGEGEWRVRRGNEGGKKGVGLLLDYKRMEGGWEEWGLISTKILNNLSLKIRNLVRGILLPR